MKPIKAPFLFNDWGIPKVVDSSDENVKKLIFTKEGDKGAVAEAVLYKYPTYQERTVICCSTQSGCPVGCRFCGTGEFFVRNLTETEIFDQVKACLDIVFYEGNTDIPDVEKLQIMFMSMGEPMLNWENLKWAMKRLNIAYPNARLLISTMGPKATDETWSDLIKVSKEIPEIGLQFSVHEAFEEDRNNLIPMSHKLDLIRIAAMGEQWAQETGRNPFFNYCVHEDNNTMKHVQELVKYFDQSIWECTLSVVCEPDEGVAAANQRQRDLVKDFMDKMLNVGYSVRMFDPAGQDDIGGGCGQLHFVQSWAREHPELLKKSHGTGLERIHAPRELVED